MPLPFVNSGQKPQKASKFLQKYKTIQINKTLEEPLANFAQNAIHDDQQNELLRDISNNRVKQIILKHPNINQLVNDQANSDTLEKQKEAIKANQTFLKQKIERKWLTKKGKKYLIDFDDQQRKEMKQYFNSLDQKKNGSIGIDQLQQLLLSVGLVQTRQEVKALIDAVDEDRSGKIEFQEFLWMIQNDEGQNEEIVAFFKSVIGGNDPNAKQNNKIHGNSLAQRQKTRGLSKFNKTTLAFNEKKSVVEILQKYPYPRGLPFEMVVSHIRRKHMMTALNIGKSERREMIYSSCRLLNSSISSNQQPYQNHTPQQIAKGQSVMKALRKMYERKLLRKIKENKKSVPNLDNLGVFTRKEGNLMVPERSDKK